jgi:hypothetical protein
MQREGGPWWYRKRKWCGEEEIEQKGESNRVVQKEERVE